MQRREFLYVAAAMTSGYGNARRRSDSDVIIETRSGKIRGAVAADGVRSFKGVPFAQPPVGALRFAAPVAAPPWTGVRDALSHALAPVQTGKAASAISEDCLHLSVYAPASVGPHPVFVWVHGGGNTSGSIHDPLYDHASFPRSGVVCVTLEYRLGALGFLELGESLGPEHADSGNNALRDLALGLKWVTENIAAFGGDPSRITLAGESAGGKNVAALIAAPSVSPNVRRAIIESGSGATAHDTDSAYDVARRFLDALGVKTDASLAERRIALFGATTEQLLAAQMRMTGRYPRAFPFRAIVGGEFLPQKPVEAMAAGAARDISLIIGTNRDESLLFFSPEAASHPIAGREMAHLTVGQIHAVRLQYEKQFPDQTDLVRRIRLLTAEEYWIPTVRMAEARATAGGETRMYRFDHAPSTGVHAGFAVHGSELAFVWDNLAATADAAAHSLARRMHGAWSAFAMEGKPAADGLPEWPLYAPKTQRQTVVFSDDSTKVVADPSGSERVIWDGVL